MTAGREGELRGFPGTGASLALYALLAIAMTWPLALHLSDRLPAGDNDLWQNYWNFWWWKTSLLERGQLPWSTDLLYQPGAVSLAFHTHSEANILTTFPILWAGGVAAALNTATLLGFVLAAWGTYLLAREWIHYRRAAFLAGVVAAYFPQHFEQSLEHLNLASYAAMPFFLYFLTRLARNGGWSNALATALAFAINSLYSWHNGLLVFPMGAAIFVHEVARSRRPWKRALFEAAAAGGIALACILPFAWPMLRAMLEGSDAYVKPALNKSIDPLFLGIPAENHPLFGPLVRGLYDRFRGYPSAGFTCYAGLGVLALWLAGVRGARRDGDRRFAWKLWSALFLVHILFALGDRLTVAGGDTGVPLPFALLRHVPFFGTIRLPNRFVVPAMLALAVLAAHGASRIAARKGSGFAALLVAIVIIDFLWVPYPLREMPHPAWLGALSRAKPGLLLDVPGGHRARGAEDMYFQTIHGRPIVGGYTSTVPDWMEARVGELPFLKLVFEGRPKVELDAAGIERELARTLEQLPVQVVVLHLDRSREHLEQRARDSAGAPELSRLYNPEKGTPARVIEDTRAALKKLWGPPLHADEAAEIYARR